jgi:uncharacterized membrane protein
VLATALVGLRDDLVERAAVSQLLVAMTATGVLVSVWLTYLELFVIHAICMWCVVSAILATVLFALSVMDLRELSGVADERSPAQPAS